MHKAPKYLPHPPQFNHPNNIRVWLLKYCIVLCPKWKQLCFSLSASKKRWSRLVLAMFWKWHWAGGKWSIQWGCSTIVEHSPINEPGTHNYYMHSSFKTFPESNSFFGMNNTMQDMSVSGHHCRASSIIVAIVIIKCHHIWKCQLQNNVQPWNVVFCYTNLL
jgi:hypothetical protein